MANNLIKEIPKDRAMNYLKLISAFSSMAARMFIPDYILDLPNGNKKFENVKKHLVNGLSKNMVHILMSVDDTQMPDYIDITIKGPKWFLELLEEIEAAK